MDTISFLQISAIWYFIIATVSLCIIEEVRPNEPLKSKLILSFAWPLVLVNRLIRMR